MGRSAGIGPRSARIDRARVPIATTSPRGPVYRMPGRRPAGAGDERSTIRSTQAFPAPVAGDPPPEASRGRGAARAGEAPAASHRAGLTDRPWDRATFELAERLGARVITDLKTGASFPTTHPLHTVRARLYIATEAGARSRGGRNLEPRLGRSRRVAAPGMPGTLPRRRSSIVPGLVFASRLEQGLSGVAAGRDFVLASPDRLVTRCWLATPDATAVPSPPRGSVGRRSPRARTPEGRFRSKRSPSHLRRSLHNGLPIFALPLGWPAE